MSPLVFTGQRVVPAAREQAGYGRYPTCSTTASAGTPRSACTPQSTTNSYDSLHGAVEINDSTPHSTLPAAMDPRQAAEAAALLEAKLAIPIHYDTLENPPLYQQVDRPAEAFVAAASAGGIKARILAAGHELDLSQSSRVADLGCGELQACSTPTDSPVRPSESVSA